MGRLTDPEFSRCQLENDWLDGSARLEVSKAWTVDQYHPIVVHFEGKATPDLNPSAASAAFGKLLEGGKAALLELYQTTTPLGFEWHVQQVCVRFLERTTLELAIEND